MGEGRLVEQVAAEGPLGQQFVRAGVELGVVAALQEADHREETQSLTL